MKIYAPQIGCLFFITVFIIPLSFCQQHLGLGWILTLKAFREPDARKFILQTQLIKIHPNDSFSKAKLQISEISQSSESVKDSTCKSVKGERLKG